MLKFTAPGLISYVCLISIIFLNSIFIALSTAYAQSDPNVSISAPPGQNRIDRSENARVTITNLPLGEYLLSVGSYNATINFSLGGLCAITDQYPPDIFKVNTCLINENTLVLLLNTSNLETPLTSLEQDSDNNNFYTHYFAINSTTSNISKSVSFPVYLPSDNQPKPPSGNVVVYVNKRELNDKIIEEHITSAFGIGTPVQFVAEGCPANTTVVFTLSNSSCSKAPDICDQGGSGSVKKERETNQNGIAIYNKDSIGSEYDNTTLNIRAWCKSGELHGVTTLEIIGTKPILKDVPTQSKLNEDLNFQIQSCLKPLKLYLQKEGEQELRIDQDLGDGTSRINSSTINITIPGTYFPEEANYNIRAECKSGTSETKTLSISKTGGDESPPPPLPQCKTIDEATGKCTEISSAIGSFATTPEGAITRLFGFLLSISGGVALLLIIRSGYEIMTSRGDPEKLKEARERLTSVIVGILFLIFSLVILEVIGVDILRLPGIG